MSYKKKEFVRRVLLAIMVICLLWLGILVVRDTVWKQWKIKGLPTTDLSGVTVDGAKIHDSIKVLDLKKYTTSDRYSGPYRYLFDEICIDVNEEEKITSLFSSFEEGKTRIEVNGRYDLALIEEATELLGDNYYEWIYDRELLLRSHTYQDKEHNIVANFVFYQFDINVEYDKVLAWIEIEKI